MSKEIALLRRVKVLLECSNMEPLQRQADLIIKEIQELLAQPEQEPLGLEIMDVCGTEDYREGFKDGALYAEKCHGIGGE